MPRPAVLLVPLLVLAQSSAASEADADLCAPLRAFADSVGPQEDRSIGFLTAWGGNFKDEPEPATYAKRCTHNDYGPARTVCAYLMANAPLEFAHLTAQEAIACLAPGTTFGPGLSLHRLEASMRHGTEDRGSHVRITFGWDDKLGAMRLTIDAAGY